MSDEPKAKRVSKPRHVFQNLASQPLVMKDIDKYYRDALSSLHGVSDQGRMLVTTFDPDNPLGNLTLQPGPEFALCQKCNLWEQGAETPFINFQGSEDPLVTVVVDAVSAKEDHYGELGAGGTSAFLKRLFTELDFDLSHVRWAPITKCAARSGSLPNFSTKGKWCRHFLVQDLMRHPPKVIIPVGSVALGLLSHKSNAQDWSGRELVYRGWPDDWLTNPDFARPRKHPADPKATIIGHPIFGPIPTHRIPVVPVQAPRIVYATQNPQLVERWQRHVKHALQCAINGVQPRVYNKAWWKLSTDPDEIEEALMELIEHPGTLAAYDTETNGVKPWAVGAAIVFMMFRWISPVTGKPRSIGFPWDYPESPLFGDVERLSPVVLQAIYKSTIVAHNAAFDALFTAANVRGAHLESIADSMMYDTWHMAYALRQATGTLGLEMIAYQWVPDMAGYEEDMALLIELHRDTLHPEEGGHYAMCPADKWETHLKPYAMGDVEVTYEAKGQIEERLTQAQGFNMPLAHPCNRGRFRWFRPPSRQWVYNSVVSPANRTLIKIMGRGMYVDTKELERLEDLFPKKIRELRGQLRAVDQRVMEWCEQKEATEPGWELDLENKTQLKECLFNVLELPVKRLTEAGRRVFGEADNVLASLPRGEAIKYAALDKYTLNMMSVDHPQVRPLQTYRKVFKEYSSYVRPMRNLFTEGLDKTRRKTIQHLARDGCVHASFLLTGTRGGRLCVSRDTELDVLVDGLPVRVAISDLYMFSGKQVVTLTHTGCLRPIRNLFFKGYEEMFYVRTLGGREIKATAGHLIHADRGWESISSLSVGSQLQVDVQAASWRYSDRGLIRGAVLGQEAWGEGDVSFDWTESMSEEQKDLWKEVRFGAQRALQCEISPVTKGKQEWKETSVGVHSKRRAGKVSHGGSVTDFNRSKIPNNGVYRSTEHRLGRSPEDWVCAVVGKVVDGREDCSDRHDVPGAERRLSQIFHGQASVLHEGVPVVSSAVGNGVVFEGRLFNSIFEVSPRKWRVGRSQLDHEPVRSLFCSGVDRSGCAICARVRVSRGEEGRFCNRGNEHFGRNRWAVPHFVGKRQKRSVDGESWIPDSTGFSERGDRVHFRGSQEDSRFGTDTVCEIRSVGLQEVWDIEVEGDHSYVANSFVHHNSCKEPNLQQLPREGLIKRVYTSRFLDRGCVYQGDLSQIELRLLAAACGDDAMVDAYHRGIDLHSLTHSKIYRKAYEECTNDYVEWLQRNNRTSDAKKVKEERKVAKCVDPLTLVSINGELRRIGELHSGREEDTFYPVAGLRIQSPDGPDVPIRNFYSNGTKRRFLVVSRRGLVVCSENHPLELFDGRLKKAGELRKGDILSGSTRMVSKAESPEVQFNPFGSQPSSGPFFTKVTPEMAYLLGLFYGDGCLNKGLVSISTGGTPSYFAWQDTISDVAKRCGFEPSIKRTLWSEETGSYGAVIFGSTRVSDLFVQLGAVSSDFRRRTLQLSGWLLNADDTVKRNFLAGWFDTDGSSTRSGCLSGTAKSWALVQDITVLLNTLGIRFTVEPSWNSKHEKWYFRVNLSVEDSFSFKGLMRHDKRHNLRQSSYRPRVSENKVVEVIELEAGSLVDVEVVSQSHLFITNGLTSRNTVNFLTGYGGGAFGLQTSLASQGIYMSLDECENILESFFDAYPSLRRYLSYYKNFILNNGVAVSILGRVRIFEEVFGDNEEAKAKALRAGCNHLIQSTASDMMLICLMVIEACMRNEGLESLLVSTVHDSLVIDAMRHELPAVHGIVDEVLNNIPSVMTAVFGSHYDTSWCIVPFAGDSEVGPNMLDAKKISTNPDWDALLAA